MILFYALLPVLAMAQPFSLDKLIKPVELKLQKINPAKLPNAKGNINATNVKQTRDTLYYFVKGVSIYSPVYVSLTAKEGTAPVKVSLHKMTWKKADREGRTNGNQQWSEKFKTENDFGIMVVPQEKPAEYTLVVWAGNEAKLDMPSVFSKEKTTNGGGNFFRKNLLYIIIIGILGLAIVILFMKLKNRKK